MKSVVKNATKETLEDLPEIDIFDRLMDRATQPEVLDLREEQFGGMAPPLYDVDIGDITYEAPTKLPMESEGIRSIGLESGGNAGIETLKQTTIQVFDFLDHCVQAAKGFFSEEHEASLME